MPSWSINCIYVTLDLSMKRIPFHIISDRLLHVKYFPLTFEQYFPHLKTQSIWLKSPFSNIAHIPSIHLKNNNLITHNFSTCSTGASFYLNFHILFGIYVKSNKGSALKWFQWKNAIMNSNTNNKIEKKRKGVLRKHTGLFSWLLMANGFFFSFVCLKLCFLFSTNPCMNLHFPKNQCLCFASLLLCSICFICEKYLLHYMKLIATRTYTVTHTYTHWSLSTSSVQSHSLSSVS